MKRKSFLNIKKWQQIKSDSFLTRNDGDNDLNLKDVFGTKLNGTQKQPLRRLNKMIASHLLVSRHVLEESVCHLEGKTLMSRQSPAVWLPCSLLPCFQFFKVFGSFFGQMFTQLYFPETAEQFCYLAFFFFFLSLYLLNILFQSDSL